MLLNISTKLFS